MTEKYLPKIFFKKIYSSAKTFIQNFYVSAMPRKLMIEPTNHCNISCPTCPTGSGKSKRARRHMTISEYRSIIDQCKGHVIDVTLWNYGEPFLNPEILNMIEYAALNKMRVMTSTNGQFLGSEEYCEGIVKSGLDRLIVCLDGADQATINKFRKNADFKKIIQGIRYIIEAKTRLNSFTPKVELQFIIMKHNAHQLSIIRDLAKGLKVDVYSEKTVGIDANDPDFQQMCREYLPDDLSLSRYYLRSEGTYALKSGFNSYCSFIYSTMVINSDGSVVPCCYDLYSKYILGNAFDQSISSIWRSKKYRNFRLKVRKGRRSIPICNICSEGTPISKRETY